MSFLARLPKALTHFTEVDVNSAFPGLKVRRSSDGNSSSSFLFALRSIFANASSRTEAEDVFLLFLEAAFVEVFGFLFKSGRGSDDPPPRSGKAGAVSDELNKAFIFPTMLSSCSFCASSANGAGAGKA